METKTHNEICELLSRHDIGPTQQRIKIAQVLCSQPRHMSAEQLLEEVNHERACVSKATIYNTLNLFVDKGLVREIIVDPSKIFYDSTVHAHHHFFNEQTGQLTDVPEGALSFKDFPPLPEGTQMSGVEVIIRVRSA
ncbi:MAG: transcriptional repressor [Pseudomonadota bacterium]